MGVVRWRMARLPYSGVWIGPAFRDMVNEVGHRTPTLASDRSLLLGVDRHGIDEPAVPVQLMLIPSRVACPHWSALLVSGPVLEAAFVWNPPTVESKQRGQTWTIKPARVQQPMEEHPRLGDLAEAKKCRHSDAGVTWPGKPVVPVANAPNLLR